MKVTNEMNLPEAFVKAVSVERHNKSGCYSATTLNKGAKETILQERHCRPCSQQGMGGMNMKKTLPAILEDAFDLQVWNEEMLDEDGTEREFSEEDRQALIQLAEENALEFSKKAEGYGKALQMIEDETTVIEARIDALKAEVKRLESRKNTRESNVNFMKSLLVRAMKITGTTKIKTPLFSFSIRKTKSLDASLANPDNLPPSFVRTKCEVDKTAINDALKAEQLIELSDGTLVYKGQILNGVKRVEKESLSIR